MEESTLRWPTDKEREEMEEVCSIGEVPHTEKRAVSDFETRLSLWVKESDHAVTTTEWIVKAGW